MTTSSIRLIDAQGAELATAQVVRQGDRFCGTIDLSRTPPPIRELFDEFEEITNGQMFSFLDEIEEKLDSLGIRARFEDRSEARVRDLQVYPATADVSFRLVEDPVAVIKSA